MHGKKTRLGLYVFYDKDAIVDDYVVYLLDDIMQNLNDIVIISNSKLDEENKQKLLKYTDKLYIRENEGLDAGALAYYFNNFDDYKKYDELVYFNDTFYGPFYPFEKIFEKMDKEDVDFWGLAKGHEQPNGWKNDKADIAPEHIQTFFIDFHHNVINSEAFVNYWKKYNVKKMMDFDSVVSKHEIYFTKYLKDNGFKYNSYVEDSFVDEDYKRNYNNYAYNCTTQIIKNKAPFLKKKNLSFDYGKLSILNDNCDYKDALDYIENNTNYDTRLIWKNILRTTNINTVKQSITLDRIVCESNHEKHSDITIFINIDNKNSVDLVKEKIINNYKNIHIYSHSKEIIDRFDTQVDATIINEDFQKHIVKDLKNVKTQYFAYFSLNDRTDSPNIVDISKNEVAIENLIKNRNYLESIIDLLKNQNVSMVYCPEVMNYDNFYKNLCWDNTIYEYVKEIVPEYKLISKEDPPYSISESWIAKSELIEKIDFETQRNINDEDFSKVLSIAMAYWGCLLYKYPLTAFNYQYATFRLRAYQTIYLKSFRKIYSKGKNYPTSFDGLLKYIRIKDINFFLIIWGIIKRKCTKEELIDALWRSKTYRRFTQSHIWRFGKKVFKRSRRD